MHGEGRFLLTLPFDLRRINPSNSDGNLLTKQWMDIWNCKRAGIAIVTAVVGDIGEVGGEGGDVYCDE